MAVTTVTSGLDQVKGIKYTVIADSSTDWPSVGNNVYFYDKATSLPYYKNAGGTVVSIFEEGGVSSNVYTADGTLVGDRTVNLNNNDLNFKDGNLSSTLTSYIGTSNPQGKFFEIPTNRAGYLDGSLWFRNLNNSTGAITAHHRFYSGGLPSYVGASGQQFSFGKTNNNSGAKFEMLAQYSGMFIHNNAPVTKSFLGLLHLYPDTGAGTVALNVENPVGSIIMARGNANREVILRGTNVLGTEKISLQGETLISEKLELSTTTDGFLMPRLTTAQKNAISTPDTNLMVFDTTLSSLQRYNGSAWVDVAAGVGIVQLTQEGGSGGSVFYTDIQSALTAANSSGGNITIILHDNIAITSTISTQSLSNIDNITINLNGFTITNTANDSGAVFYLYSYNNRILRIINGSIIKSTGTGNALHFPAGVGDLYMSNCYVYSEAGSALKIEASVTPINIWELGNTTFKTNTGYGVYLADALGGISLTNFISISTGSGMACFLNAGGDVTNFKAIAEGTGTSLRVRSAVTSATNFYAESNSGNCVLLESLTPMVKDFTAISVSGYAVYSSASSYKIENFYCKTTSGLRTLNVTANSILINGDVFSDSTNCAFVSNAERIENVNFTTNSGTYAVQSRFTTNWINCTFRNKDGIAFYNYSPSTSKFKKCTFISEKTSGGTAHAANILDGASVITFVNCDFEVADSTVNCIKANAAMNMKVANSTFDGATTAINANVTLSNTNTTDDFGNILIG